jgi:hypothetical protein
MRGNIEIVTHILVAETKKTDKSIKNQNTETSLRRNGLGHLLYWSGSALQRTKIIRFIN